MIISSHEKRGNGKSKAGKRCKSESKSQFMCLVELKKFLRSKNKKGSLTRLRIKIETLKPFKNMK